MNLAYITHSQARRLPFWLLATLVLVYAVAGFIGRDPWKTDDAASFGVMLTMAQGEWRDWFLPNVMGAPITHEGPLFFWIGAACIKLLSVLPHTWLNLGLSPAYAARLGTICLILLGVTWVWRATYGLARRPEAQPNNPLGTAPTPQEYGRMMADAAVLLLLASLGMVVRIHETTSEVGQWACCCLALYALASHLERPNKGGMLFGLAVSASLLGSGVLPAGMLLFSAAAALLWCARLRFHAPRLLVFGCGIPMLLTCLWWLSTRVVLDTQEAALYFAHWGQANLAQLDWGMQQSSQWQFLFSNAWLFTWPLWPLALYAGYAWRKQAHAPSIAVPISFTLAAIVAQFFGGGPSDVQLLLLYPPLAILAAFGIPALRRSVVNLIDWFAAMSFTLVAILLWVGWCSLVFGIPQKLARSASRLAPDFHGAFVWWEFLVAICLTLVWLWIILWRTQRRPQALWRAVALSMAGLLLVWSLATTLWLPWVNSSKTYRVVAQQLAAQIPRHLAASEACINTVGLGLAQRASFAYFANLHFAALDFAGEQPTCRWVLLQDNPHDGGDDTLPDVREGLWKKVWEGRRASDRNERFRLYEAVPYEKRKPKFRRR